MKRVAMAFTILFLTASISFAQQEYPFTQTSQQEYTDMTKSYLDFIRELKASQSAPKANAKRNLQLEQMFSTAYYLAAMLRSVSFLITLEQQHGAAEQYNAAAAAVIAKYLETLAQEVNTQKTNLDNITSQTKDSVVLDQTANYRVQLNKILSSVGKLSDQLKIQ